MQLSFLTECFGKSNDTCLLYTSYADPSSVLRASVMLLEHIGEIELAGKLDRALDICMFEEKKVVVNGRDTGATAQEFTDYVLDTIAKL